MNDSALSEIYNFFRLSDPIATSGQPKENEFKLIADEGFKMVINLAFRPSENSPTDEESLVKSLGMEYAHIPVIWEMPKLEDFETFVRIMDQHRDQGLFIHCVANMRVSVFMALYRVTQEGWDLAEAVDFVREIWEPDWVWRDFMNGVLSHYGKKELELR